MSSAARREWVSAIGISLPNPAIPSVDDVLRAVATSKLSPGLDRFSLGLEVPGSTAALDLDIPTVIAGNHMNVLLHRYLQGLSTSKCYSAPRRPLRSTR